MANKLDLNKIRDEINKEKQSRNMIPSQLGENVGRGVAPRDEFLNGLLTSLHSGKETAASTLIKVVENKVAEKHGEAKKLTINEVSTAPVQNQRPAKIDMSPERDEQLYVDLENKRKQTLAESIQQFTNSKTGTPPAQTANYNGTQYLTSAPNAAPVGAPMQLNEAALVENVKNVVNGYLSENLGAVFEEAIKGTIIEMYAVEQIKKVLNENRDLIGSVVKEVIREIQAKNKAKTQS